MPAKKLVPKPVGHSSGRDFKHMRWTTLLLSLGLIGLSLVLKLAPSLVTKDSAVASDVFGKVGIVFLCVWLSWPAIEMILKSPKGAMLVVAGVFATALFVMRPKTILITGPFLVIAALLAILSGWFRRKR